MRERPAGRPARRRSAARRVAGCEETGRDEAGVATVVALGLIGVVLLLTLVAVALAAVVGARHRAEAAADLGALAGAVAVRDGGDGCAAASRVAASNDGRVTSCVVTDRTVEVTVVVTTGRMLGTTWDLTGVARAGPASAAQAG